MMLSRQLEPTLRQLIYFPPIGGRLSLIDDAFSPVGEGFAPIGAHFAPVDLLPANWRATFAN